MNDTQGAKRLMALIYPTPRERVLNWLVGFGYQVSENWTIIRKGRSFMRSHPSSEWPAFAQALDTLADRADELCIHMRNKRVEANEHMAGKRKSRY